MPLQAGALDRKITIQKPEVTRGAMGGEITGWSLFASVWAEKIPLRASERLAAAQIRASQVEIFRVRYLPGLNSTMRILLENQTYRIVGIAEIERRVSIEITAEFLEGNGGG